MLAAMRNRAGGVFAKILLGLLVLSFGIWGIGDIFRSHGGNSTVASVAGTRISAMELEQNINRELEGFRRMMGAKYNADLVKKMGLPQQILNNIIDRTLLLSVARDAHLQPTDETAYKRIASIPAFKGQDGKFDKFAFDNAVREMGISKQEFIQQMKKDDAVRLLLTSLATPPEPLPDALLSHVTRAKNAQHKVELLRISSAAAAPKNAATPEDIKQYYDDHPMDFTTPELRNVTYVLLSPTTLAGHVTVTDADVEALYKSKIASYTTPETRNVEQILLPTEDAAKQAAALLKDTPMPGVAEKIKGASYTDIGSVTPSSVPAEAQETIFSLPKNTFSTPVKTGFGWHIFRVTQITPARVTPLTKVADALRKELATSKAQAKLSDISTQVDDALAGGATLEDAIKDTGLVAVHVGPITAEGKTSDGKPVALPPLKDFVKEAFNVAQGETSPLIPAGNTGYYIIRADKVTPAALKPLENVKAEVAAAWRTSETKNNQDRLATDAMKHIESGKNAAEAAQKTGITREEITLEPSATSINGVAVSANILNNIRNLPRGKWTEPFTLADGSIALARVQAVYYPTPHALSDAEKQKQSAELGDAYTEELTNALLVELRRQNPPKVNRDVLENLLK